jgi:hypothetical protein
VESTRPHAVRPAADYSVTMRRRTTPRPRWGAVRLRQGPTDPPRHLARNTSGMTRLKLAVAPSEILARDCRPHGGGLRLPRSHARAAASRGAPGTPVGPGSCPRMRSMLAATLSGSLSLSVAPLRSPSPISSSSEFMASCRFSRSGHAFMLADG